MMERERERERELLDNMETPQTINVFRFYFHIFSLQNKVLTVDGVKVKLQVRSLTFFIGSERLLLLPRFSILTSTNAGTGSLFLQHVLRDAAWNPGKRERIK